MNPELRARIRAAIIAVAVLVHGFAALPLPHSAKRSSLDLPVAREEITRWSKILTSWGYAIEPDALADESYAVTAALAEFRKAIMKPFQGWFRITGTGQSWGLFTYPDSYPHQLRIETRTRTGKFETIYAGLDPDHTWMRDRFVYRRVRGVYDGSSHKPGAAWDNFSDWVAAEAFWQFPDVYEVRVSFMKLHTVPPWEENTEAPARKFARLHKRDDGEHIQAPKEAEKKPAPEDEPEEKAP